MRSAIAASALLIAALTASPALAHVTLESKEAPVGAPYKADDGANVDTMFLVYQVTLPGLAKK